MENEIKLALSAGSYIKLLEILPVEKTLKQCNNFFDTAGGYFQNSCFAFRLRSEDEQCFRAALKKRLSLEQGYFQAMEIESTIDEQTYRSALDGLQTSFFKILEILSSGKANTLGHEIFRHNFHSEKFICRGFFLNLRSICRLKDFQIEIDCTDFGSGRTEYELECETDLKNIPLITGFLKKNNIDYSFSVKSKFERYCEYSRQ
ncbi:MAG: hypothetical protein A2096_01035 [Spirochaetes bacterium GWF1_41_5]|nr:MAG: hypothetical protein A2096_01035 [Spirochaetes bacterium GWF1_41_5]HBE04437.1 hypothetical protein [Spirochaetia bacterium]